MTTFLRQFAVAVGADHTLEAALQVRHADAGKALDMVRRPLALINCGKRAARDAIFRAKVWRFRSPGDRWVGDPYGRERSHRRARRVDEGSTSQHHRACGMIRSRSLRTFAWTGRTCGTAADGFTLIELLVVLTIIGLIMGLIGPRVLGYLEDSRAKTAKLQIESLSSALDLFYLDAGRYPTTSEGLDALAQRPSDIGIWNGPYIKGGRVPADPWGHPYQYRSPVDHTPPYEIVSFGSDGREGGSGNAADISNVEH
jgi:general secretion pathway protein G